MDRKGLKKTSNTTACTGTDTSQIKGSVCISHHSQTIALLTVCLKYYFNVKYKKVGGLWGGTKTMATAKGQPSIFSAALTSNE